MVVATSSFVPCPRPAEHLARKGLQALALLLAAGLLHTQVSKQGWKVWEKCVWLSCEEPVGPLRNLPCFPAVSLAHRAIALSCLQPMSLPSVSACIPSPFPSLAAPNPAAPVPANASSSAGGCLISGEAQLIPPALPEGQFGTHFGGGLLQEPAPSVPVPGSIGRGGWARGCSAALQFCPFPAGLPFGTLLPAGL